MAIPRVEKEKEKEKGFLEKLLASGIDTQKLDEAWQSYRYAKKHGLAKYLDERDKLKETANEKSREKDLIQPEKVLKTAGTIPKVEKIEDEFTLGDERMPCHC